MNLILYPIIHLDDRSWSAPIPTWSRDYCVFCRPDLFLVTFGPWKLKSSFEVEKVIFIKNNCYHWILRLKIDINTYFYKNWTNFYCLVFLGPGGPRACPGMPGTPVGWVGALKFAKPKFSNWADTIPPRYARFLSNLRYFTRGGVPPPPYTYGGLRLKTYLYFFIYFTLKFSILPQKNPKTGNCPPPRQLRVGEYLFIYCILFFLCGYYFF